MATSNLNGKGWFIIGTHTTPTSTEKNTQQFCPKSLVPIYDTLASENSGRTDDGVMHIY